MRLATLTTQDALRKIRDAGASMSLKTLQHGLQSGVLPFGHAIKCESEYSYLIFAKDLDAWIAEHSIDDT